MATRNSNTLLSGMRLPMQGAQLLLRLPQVKRVAILPIIVTFIVYVTVAGTALWWIGQWDWNLGEEPWQFWGWFGEWLHGALDRSLDVVKWLVVIPLLLAVCYFTFTAVGMVLASPFNDILSERIELAICEPQNRPVIAWKEQGKLIMVSIIDSLTILIRQVGWILLTLPFLIIPYLGFLICNMFWKTNLRA
jgi:CysZ protein